MEPLTYEVQVRCISASAEFYVDQRFPFFPDRETLVALKDEAEGTFGALFDHPVEEMYVSLSLTESEQPETEEAEVHED